MESLQSQLAKAPDDYQPADEAGNHPLENTMDVEINAPTAKATASAVVPTAVDTQTVYTPWESLLIDYMIAHRVISLGNTSLSAVPAPDTHI